jgi:DNA repair photolyase
MTTDYWKIPVRVTPNNFIYKSLSSWALNFAVGCNHACRFCYVPDASANKLAPNLREFGVQDPDAEWGEYVLVRPFDHKAFQRSVQKAEATDMATLNKDGNRAVMLCSTTDAYQVLKQPYLDALRNSRRECLKIIRDESTLNVRILTRSPLVREDFDILKSFGNRLLLGMSIPTLRNDLAKIYEPKAPAPTVRLSALEDAKSLGLNIYVAMAPTYPECDAEDIGETLMTFKDLNPVTIFHEPINIRAQNVARIAAHAEELGTTLKTEVFKSPTAWRSYALQQLLQVEENANFLRLNQLHLWPDKSLGSKVAIEEAQLGGHRTNQEKWLKKWWTRVSEWPR